MAPVGGLRRAMLLISEARSARSLLISPPVTRYNGSDKERIASRSPASKRSRNACTNGGPLGSTRA